MVGGGQWGRIEQSLGVIWVVLAGRWEDLGERRLGVICVGTWALGWLVGWRRDRFEAAVNMVKMVGGRRQPESVTVTLQSWRGEFDGNDSLARQQKPGQLRVGKNRHGEDFFGYRLKAGMTKGGRYDGFGIGRSPQL